MDDQNRTVNLSKPVNSQPQPWSDPVTGEIYPGGNPNAVPQPTVSAAYPGSVQQPINSGTAYPNTYPNQQPYPQQPYAQQQYGQPVPMQGGQMMYPQDGVPYPQPIPNASTKFCSRCGNVIALEAVICPRCGCQVGQMQSPQAMQPAQSPIIINNNNNNVAAAPVVYQYGRPKNKWVAFFLCFFLGVFGVHRFYEGKIGTGLLYLFTLGLGGIGVLIDLIILLCKPNPYYVL